MDNCFLLIESIHPDVEIKSFCKLALHGVDSMW